MRRVLLIGAMTTLAAVTGCSAPEPAHDISYYRGHPNVRVTKVKVCQADRGRLAATANCVNAIAADGEAVSKRFWGAPKSAPRVADPGKL